MATINEITQGQSYTGNAALGGYIPDAVQIDINPVMQLAAYTKMNNEALFKQRQLDADQRITELSELSEYNIDEAVGKDRDKAMEIYKQLQDFAAEQARLPIPNTPHEKVAQRAAFKLKSKEAIDKINGYNKRGIAYKRQLNQIKSDPKTTAETKALKKKYLDEQFDNSEWYQALTEDEKYETVMPTIGKAQMGEHEVNVGTGNSVVKRKITFFDSDKTREASVGEAIGMHLTPPPEGATPEQKRKWEESQAAMAGSTQKAWQDSANVLTEAIQSGDYINPTTKQIDLAKLKRENPIAGRTYELALRYNEYNQRMRDTIQKGFYTTKLNERVALSDEMKKKRFDLIDLSQPLQPEDILTLGKFSEAAPDKMEELVTFTGEQLKKQNMALDWYNAKTARVKAASGDGTPATGSDQTALLFGEHINGVKRALAKSGGKGAVVSFKGTDEKTRNALGMTDTDLFVLYKPDGTAMVGVDKNGNGGRPLTVEQQKTGFFTSVRGGNKDETGLDSKFIEEQEQGFRNIYGTTSGTDLWNAWGDPRTLTVAKKTTGGGGTTKTISRASLASDAKAAGYSIAEYEDALKKQGFKITN